jgi:hypothetical protein
MTIEEISAKIVHDAKERLKSYDWTKCYDCYLEALLSEYAADTLKVFEQQHSREALPPP